MKDITDLADIKIFVNEFYNKVRKDELIGPVFSQKITGDWQPHLDKMYAFWNAALFAEPRYRGNPFAKHAPLKISSPHFERWLVLFADTIDSNFTGPMAVDTKKRAGLMADIFLVKLERMNGDPGKAIV